MYLTRENYHSIEARKGFFGSSQFKDFLTCSNLAMATINGEFEKKSDALIQGQLLDAYFENELELFSAKHPEMFLRNGELKSLYKFVENAIETIENDAKMSELCKGEQQKIVTGEIDKVPFKIMIDSLLPDRIVDRKLMKNFNPVWSKEEGNFVPWWKSWRYDIQAAIYVEIYRQNFDELPFELVAVSKEKVPDKAWIRFSPQTIEKTLDEIRYKLPEFVAIKEGLFDAKRCEVCDYCKFTKKINLVEEV